MPVPRPTRGLRPPTVPITITSKKVIKQGERGAKLDFFAYTSPPVSGGAWLTLTTQTTAQVVTTSAPPVNLPSDAVAVIILVTLSANTATAGSASFHAYANDTDSGGLGSGSVASVACPMVSANFQVRQQLIVPLVDGAMRWEVPIAGTVNYTLTVHFCGYVRG